MENRNHIIYKKHRQLRVDIVVKVTYQCSICKISLGTDNL